MTEKPSSNVDTTLCLSAESEEVPPESPVISNDYSGTRLIPTEDLENYKAQKEIDNNSQNQELARTLIKYTLLGLGIFCVAALAFIVVSVMINEENGITFAEGVFDKSLTIVSSALFTFLGFLFGERSSKK